MFFEEIEVDGRRMKRFERVYGKRRNEQLYFNY